MSGQSVSALFDNVFQNMATPGTLPSPAPINSASAPVAAPSKGLNKLVKVFVLVMAAMAVTSVILMFMKSKKLKGAAAKKQGKKQNKKKSSKKTKTDDDSDEDLDDDDDDEEDDQTQNPVRRRVGFSAAAGSPSLSQAAAPPSHYFPPPSTMTQPQAGYRGADRENEAERIQPFPAPDVNIGGGLPRSGSALPPPQVQGIPPQQPPPQQQPQQPPAFDASFTPL